MNRKNKQIATIVKILFWLAIIVFFYWIIHNEMLIHVYKEPNKFFNLLKQHITIVFISGLVAILTSIPLGIILTRPKFQKLEWLFVNTVNLGQTIPSLAVLALAMGFLGIGIKSAIVALYLFSLLPILQNTIAGINSVDEKTLDAAKGMGLTPLQILWRVELPQASYSIFAGIRTALVINVGTAALAYLIGGGGLGVWIFTGIQLFDNSFLLSGAIPLTILALLVDYLCKGLEFLIVPKGIRIAKKTISNDI